MDDQVAHQTDPVPPEPPHNCALCPRLAAFRAENAEAHPDWFNGPAPSFGEDAAQLLIVGLAPGLQGANRTGRPFTGDYAGDLLYATLDKFQFSKGVYDKRPDDGLRLIGAMITNAVRCVPPQNKPTGAEIKTCRPFLMARMQAQRIQIALVIDEYGGTDGLVSLEDIVEMVVGDIEDE
ncbi:MAG: uracil-DNA glycosylase family protein, partial [Pseudomonadota bacterium]